jgi:hypothetical protein
MYLRREIVVVCICSAFLFGIRAILLSNKRWRVIIPAVALSLLALYELSMDHWENSVRAPIRLDLFWKFHSYWFSWYGALAFVYSGQENKSNSEARQRLSTYIRRQKIDLVRHNAIT